MASGWCLGDPIHTLTVCRCPTLHHLVFRPSSRAWYHAVCFVLLDCKIIGRALACRHQVLQTMQRVCAVPDMCRVFRAAVGELSACAPARRGNTSRTQAGC